MFTARSRGVTLRRVEDYIRRPHDAAERTDPDFRVAMRCEACGKLAYGPRSLIREAVAEHQRSECPARKSQPDSEKRSLTRIFYPRA